MSPDETVMARLKSFREILEEKMASGPVDCSNVQPTGKLTVEWTISSFAQTAFHSPAQARAYRAWSHPHPVHKQKPTVELRLPPRAMKEKDAPRKPRIWNVAQTIALEELRKMGAAEIDECSCDAEIKRAYRRLARKFHPDMHQAAEQAKYTQEFCRLHEIFEILSGPEA